MSQTDPAAAQKALKFARLSPEDRRVQIIESTLELLRQEGGKALSVRRICQRAGVSLGLVNHHFGSREELLAQSYRLASLRQMEQFNARLATEPRSSSLFIDCYLSPEMMQPESLRLWIAFWESYAQTERMREVHEESFGSYRKLLEDLLAEDFPAPDTRRKISLGLLALMDGLWLEASLNPATFSREEARAIARDWLALWYRRPNETSGA